MRRAFLGTVALVHRRRQMAAALSGSPTARLWVDTDAGFDDLLALGALASSDRLAVVTVGSGACETPASGADRCARFLARVGRDDVAVVAGMAAPAVADAPWLGAARRAMVDWCASELPPARTPFAVATTADDLAAFVAARAGRAPDALALGPPTNVAAALDAVAPRTVTLMGGNRLDGDPAPLPEFNFGSDPAAAAAVVARAADVYLVGKDVCDSYAGAAEVAAAGGPLGSLAAADAFAVVCDPLAAFAVVDAAAFA